MSPEGRRRSQRARTAARLARMDMRAAPIPARPPLVQTNGWHPPSVGMPRSGRRGAREFSGREPEQLPFVPVPLVAWLVLGVALAALLGSCAAVVLWMAS